MLSCRVLDPVDEPVRQAEFTVTDTAGRKVLAGETDDPTHSQIGFTARLGAYPTLEFYSDRFVHRGGSRWAVTGALTLHGVSRTVTLDTQYLGLGDGLQGETRGIAAVGSSVTIDLDIQIVPTSS